MLSPRHSKFRPPTCMCARTVDMWFKNYKKGKEACEASSNGDLWQLFWEAKQVHDQQGNFQLSKVKAHCSDEEVLANNFNLFEYTGNLIASKLAEEGA